ncbi:hypothetical protein [Pseudomonas sp. N040]|uniref:hypothetical protein n=1 Tax=Pseudomonas sp. N040 TaxID=2785325 RepID=UPI0018A28F8D|nr:hypothetical protein [Pseudomonas sp. N040]MBF7728835.1 hypothetical protein [Pseudomonas sp. N040]MBW7012475.1 hypothetical protein [Pseudomonas sp. N040]
MDTANLRQLITSAYQQEAATGQLRKLLSGQLDKLHPAIRLPAENDLSVLTGFVSAYIEQVPDVLDAAASVAAEAGLEAQIKPILRMAEGFFVRPPAVMEGHSGLESLLDEAYLAHRLVEEVNDLFITHLGQPLIPLDTTIANLVAHRLIGEPFANQLDEAVHEAMQGLIHQPAFSSPAVQAYREILCSAQTSSAWQRWPCLSRQLGIELELGQTSRSSLAP